MQLKNIRGQISLATCTLLQVSASAQGAGNDWDVDTSFLYYSESDGRVSAFEPAVRAEIDLGDDEYVNFQIVLDALTGATPNGAHKSTVVQTFTNPSGNGSYTIQPGELPLSDTFRDNRVAITGEWDKPINRMSSILLGASLSNEYDYLSLGFSATYEHEFNNKHTTLSTGLAFTSDTITPIGGITQGLSPMRRGGSQTFLGVDDTKDSVDFIIGVTQILNRTTLVQLNYTHGSSSGYHNDYINVLTVIDPATNEPLTGAWLGADNLPYLFEQRPDSRSKDIIFLRGVHHLTEDVINVSFRLFSDDWGISSNTLDFRYRYELGGGDYLQPHIRYYTQDAADFFRHDLVQGTDLDAAGNALLQYASHDYRLAKFASTTVGLKYGFPLTTSSEFSARAEVITQTTDDGNVRAGEETPDLTAFIIQANYSFRW